MSNAATISRFAGRIENLAFLAEQLIDDLNKETFEAKDELAQTLASFEDDLSEAESILRTLKHYANAAALVAEKAGA